MESASRIGLSIERARGYSSVAARCLNESLPTPVPFEATPEERELGASDVFGGAHSRSSVPPSLLPHQRAGVEWLLKLYYNGLGGVLADEMGLGKTVQIASLFSALVRLRCFGTHLVVAPLVTLDNWEREIKKWCPLIPVIVYHGTALERESKRRWLLKRQREAALNTNLHGTIADCSKPLSSITKDLGTVVITSFETVLTPNSPLGSVPFDTLVVDEAHRLKNRDCKLIRVLRRFKADTRILLTGTPLQNNLTELWSIINFVMPSMFPSSEAFEGWIDGEEARGEEGSGAYSTTNSEGGGGEGGRRENDDDGDDPDANSSPTSPRQGLSTKSARQMKNILRPFVLRRTKAEIETLALPPKYQIILRIDLSEYEQIFYNRIRRGDEDGMRLNNKLMHLRKACCHPFLFDQENPFTDLFSQTPLGEWPIDMKRKYFEALMEKGSKLRTLHSMLLSLKRKGHRVLIFSQFTTVLDLIEDYLFVYNETKGVGQHEGEGEGEQGSDGHDRDTQQKTTFLPTLKSCRLDGTNSREEKGEIVAAFSGVGDADPPFIFLISTRSGGVGINLTAADTVILYDGDFNPQNDYQAIDRCHRIGQTRPVAVYRLICRDTVEEAMLRRALGKVQLDRALFAGGEFSRLDHLEDNNKDDHLSTTKQNPNKKGPSSSSSSGGASEEEMIHKMTMAYNFGKTAKALTDEELEQLLDRNYVAKVSSSDGGGGADADSVQPSQSRRIRFE